MPMPIVGSWAQRLYDRLGSLQRNVDAANGWPLLTYLGAIGDNEMQLVEDLVVDRDSGINGWAILFDANTCPAYALPWLGQLVGVTVDTTLNETAQREQIVAVGGWRRGSPDSMLNAAKPYLSGLKFTQMVERYGGDAYQILYITHTAETPADPTAMQDAVIAQKPAGIILTFANFAGQSWGDLKTLHGPTWQDVKNNYALWNDVRNG